MNKSRKRKSVLLVGDSYFIQNGVAGFFQKRGYDIRSIGSEGQEILAGIRLEPEIIIVDYKMQHNDPYLVIAILHKALPYSYIAIMNGHTRLCNQMKARSAGATKILSQTCDVSDLNETLLMPNRSGARELSIYNNFPPYFLRSNLSIH